MIENEVYRMFFQTRLLLYKYESNSKVGLRAKAILNPGHELSSAHTCTFSLLITGGRGGEAFTSCLSAACS